MFARTRLSTAVHSSSRRVASAAAAALMLVLSAPVDAQEPEAARKHRDREPVVFTVDVAEDLAGKFVPTFVKPEHTQPERGSFFVTEGRIFPAGTIQGDGAGFDPNSRGHIGVWICRGTHLVPGVVKSTYFACSAVIVRLDADDVAASLQ